MLKARFGRNSSIFKPQLLRKINTYFGSDYDIIKDIKFHISTIENKKTIRQEKHIKKTDPIISDKKLKKCIILVWRYVMIHLGKNLKNL